MGYSATELYELQKKPKRNKITIQLLQEYYEIYLRPFNFRYELSDGTFINLKFDKKRFSHLLGVETVAKSVIFNKEKLKNYRGERAYKRIKNGEVTDYHLRNLNEGVFYGKALRGKFLYFYQIPHILLSHKAMFQFKKVSGSNIECEILIYDVTHGVCVHLGIEKDDSGKFYVPRTFFVDQDTKYVDDQTTEIEVDAIEQIDLSNNKVVRSINLYDLRNATPKTSDDQTDK